MRDCGDLSPGTIADTPGLQLNDALRLASSGLSNRAKWLRSRHVPYDKRRTSTLLDARTLASSEAYEFCLLKLKGGSQMKLR